MNALSHSHAGGRWSARRVLGAATVALALLFALTGCSIHIGSPSVGAVATSTNGTTVTIKVVHGQNGATLVLLPVTINGKGPFTFALDTGASTSLIDRPLAQQLHLPQNGSPQPIAGVSGKEQAVPVKVSAWSVGTKIQLPVSTVASAKLFASQRSSGMQGLLGSDIWTQFGKITIDYSAQTLTVYKQFSGAAGGSGAVPRDILAADGRLPSQAARRAAA